MVYKARTNIRMEQSALKNLSNCLNDNIYSYLETSSGQSSNLYLDVVRFLNTGANQTSKSFVESDTWGLYYKTF